MVHENNPSAEHQQHQQQDEGIVNSTSLEDVALSEMSDNRAQSIQSLHSVLDTPTPDTAPTFDELQQRLEASNRNMQHLQDEQQKLLQIQNMAKSHLNEMEHLRLQAARMPANGSAEAPNYESVQQVQDDMASLVGRMKNLTAFIHNQNELSSVLGDDGPEILAEQQALQEKLESLRSQREDMRNLVDELNSINRTAKEANKARRENQNQREEAASTSQKATQAQAAPAAERVVPVEYVQTRRAPVSAAPVAAASSSVNERSVPIIRQEAASAAQRALQAQVLIQQKTADIDALKSQMARLKSMLNTVTQIEESTPNVVGESLEREDGDMTNEISDRVHALNDVTSELRAEAASLQKERDRILSLKAEIERRKLQAAAAVQLGEEALKRSSLTPTPTPGRQREIQQEQEEEEEEEEEAQEEIETPLQTTPTRQQLRDELRVQCERLRKEYEAKQRELEQQYNHRHNNNNINNNTTSEADDEGNDDTDSDKYFVQGRTASSATLKRTPSSCTVVEPRSLNQSTRDEDLNVTIDSLSLGNDSLPSSSNRSQYMPPPMQPVQGMWATHNAGLAWSTHGQQPIYAPNAGGGNIAAPAPAPAPAPPPTHTGAATNAPNTNPPTSDAVLLQQFLQTQQMLINSVCQCNQTLWHQQREIDSLNSQLHALQDRFSVVVPMQDHGFGLRAESVPPPPPPTLGLGQMPNNLCLGGGGASNRAQSEQLFSFGAHQSAFANYQRNSHRNVGTASSVYSNSSDAHVQQQTFLNNAAPPTQAPPTTHYNNETPLSPHSYRASPGPIFMNHHNNTIHQNNANLRTQNQHANNLHSLPEVVPGGGAPPPPTLNNQVPPGNRANNYWDNFRR
ncbi:uncharacterized protein Dwil_GK17086 [Drosophila willistoni]|uniref:Uncharacterized protein n=1 Tax=Drosophila willistoni TaxID=7260 RepID=A0A0Q9WP10_DROWI|nr:uncharacterized protein Dwil_GK17086 [Drosophila willistoni]